MARTSNIFKLSQNASLKDVLQFMQRVNDVLKVYKSPGQKRPKKRFTPEEMKALATAMLKPEGFTSKDVIAATSYTSPAQANKFLAALEQKGLITITSVLKKSLVPDRDPNAPETRGRKAQSAEFDIADDPTGMDFSDFDNLDLSDPTSLYENKNNNNNNMSDNLTNYIKKVINEAKNPLAAKLKEVEAQGRIASLESKLAAIQEMIEETNSRLTRIDEDNEFSEMMDKKAVKDVRKQLKELERAEAKLQKEYDKVSGGRKKETVVDEDMPITNDEVAEETLDNAVDEVELEEDDLRFEGLNGVHDLKPMVTMNESLLRMQKLAGLITEGEFAKRKSLNESPASNLEIKRLAKLLFTKFKKSGARVKLGTDVGTIDQKGKVDGWDDISQALGDNDAIINYGIGNGKEGIHLSLVGDKANSLQGEIEDFINRGDVKLFKYPNDMPFKDSKGKMRKAQAYFIEPGKSMSEGDIKPSKV